MSTQELSFDYEDRFGAFPDAYETLLADIVRGDATLFVHGDEAEEAWRVYSEILDNDAIEVHPYPSRTWGPGAAETLIQAPPTEEVAASDDTC